MIKLLKQYKREFLYVVILFVLWEFALIPENIGVGWIYPILILLGSTLLIVWLVTNYSHYAHKGISEYTEVLVKINLKQRFFAFFVTPLLFYISISLYLGGIESMILRQFTIILGSIIQFVMFVHIRSSYQKTFSMERNTRFIFQIVDLVLFYIGVTGFVLLGTDILLRIVGATVLGFLLLTHQLLLHKQYSAKAVLILLTSVAGIALSAMYFASFGAIIFPLYLSVVFYLILSLWGIRLNGITKLEDYVTPILFSLMALMVLFSF